MYNVMIIIFCDFNEINIKILKCMVIFFYESGGKI